MSKVQRSQWSSVVTAVTLHVHQGEGFITDPTSDLSSSSYLLSLKRFSFLKVQFQIELLKTNLCVVFTPRKSHEAVDES